MDFMLIRKHFGICVSFSFLNLEIHTKKISRSEWFNFYIRDNLMYFLRRGGAKFSQQNQLRIFFNLVWSIKNTMATKTVWITSSNYLNWNGPQIWHESKYSEQKKTFRI